MTDISTGIDNSFAAAVGDNEDVTVVSDLKKRKRMKGDEEKNVKESLVSDVVSNVVGNMGNIVVGTDVNNGGDVVMSFTNLLYDAYVDNDVTTGPGVQACKGKCVL